MEKMPQGLMNGGGRMFFPGGDRGATHTAILVGLAMILLSVAGWVCYTQLEDRFDDRAQLIQDYQQAIGEEDPPLTFGPGGTGVSASMIRIAKMPDSELEEAITTFHSHEYKGYLALLLVLAVTLLLTGQVTWRMTLSGISRSLSGVLAGLLIVVLLVVPYIVQIIGDSTSDMEDQKISQFSPIAGGINAVTWGKAEGRAAIMSGDGAKRMQGTADSHQWRWVTYASAVSALAAGLLMSNLVSRRKILERVKKLSEGEQAPAPVQLTQEQVQQAIAAVTVPEQPAAPETPPAPPPDFVSPPPPELDDIQEIDDTPRQ
jgi:hypothetical protein